MNVPFRSVLGTKTGKAGVLAILGGILVALYDGDWSSALDKILLGVGLLTGRHAISKATGGD